MPDIQRVLIPMAGGLDESTEARLSPPGRLLKAENAHWNKSGEIVRRPGFSALTRSLMGVAPPNMPPPIELMSLDGELVSLTRGGVYAYAPDEEAWIARGYRSPATLRKQSILGTATSAEQTDSALSTDLNGKPYILHGNSGYSLPSGIYAATNKVQVITCGLSDLDGRVVIKDTIIALGREQDALGAPHAVRCFGTYTAGAAHKICAAYLRSLRNQGAAHTLNVHDCDIDNQENGVARAPAYTIASVYADYNNARTYDIVGIRSGAQAGKYFVAWLKDRGPGLGGDVILELRDSTHAIVATATITWLLTGHRRVALAHAPVAGIMLLLVDEEDDASHDRRIKAYGITIATCATLWGPVTLAHYVYNANAPVRPDILAIGEGPSGVALASWGLRTPELTDFVLHYWECNFRSFTTISGAGLSALWYLYRTVPASRPFHLVVDGVDCMFMLGRSVAGDYLYESTCLWYFTGLEGNAYPKPHYVGAWDHAYSAAAEDTSESQTCVVSTGNVGNIQPGIGTGRTATWHFGESVRSETVPYGTLPGNELDTWFHSWRSTHLRIMFDEVPSSVRARAHLGMIGGAANYIYDGAQTFEHGFAHPPHVAKLTNSNGAGSVTAGTYQYMATWEHRDASGYLHRSAPSRSRPITIAAPNDTIAIDTRCLGLTERWDDRWTNYMSQYPAVRIWRVSAADNNWRRISPSQTAPRNLAFQWALVDCSPWNDTVSDYGTETAGPLLYTTGNELEAVPVDGCAFYCVTNNRVWAAGGPWRQVVYWSKRLAAQIAPEFNEAFGVSSFDGQEVTCIGALDDKLVIFGAHSVSVVVGRGPNDDGTENDFSDINPVSTQIGCSHPKSVVSFPEGLMFRDGPQMWLLTRGMELKPIGDAIQDHLDAYTSTTASCVWPEQQVVVQCMVNAAGTVGRVMVYNYNVHQWSEWRIRQSLIVEVIPVAACVNQGQLCIASSTGYVFVSSSTYGDWNGTVPIVLSLQTGWVQVAQPGGWQIVQNVTALCQRVAAADVQVDLYRDFMSAAAFSQAWTDAQLVAMGEPCALEFYPSPVNKCAAVSVGITDLGTSLTVGATIQAVVVDAAPLPLPVRVQPAYRAS